MYGLSLLLFSIEIYSAVLDVMVIFCDNNLLKSFNISLVYTLLYQDN